MRVCNGGVFSPHKDQILQGNHQPVMHDYNSIGFELLASLSIYPDLSSYLLVFIVPISPNAVIK